MSLDARPNRPLDPRPTSHDRQRTTRAHRAPGRTCARAAVALAGLALAVLAPAQAAQAHARLVRTDPGDGTRLTRPPAQATFTFDDPIGKNLARAELSGPRGKLTLKPQVDGRQVRVPLPDVAGWAAITGTSGTEVSVMITYRVVSADGHPVSGQLRFSVPVPSIMKPPGTASAGASASPSPTGAVATIEGGGASPSPTEASSTEPGPSPSATTVNPLDPVSSASGGARWAIAVVAILGAAAAAVTMVLRRRRPGPGQGRS